MYLIGNWEPKDVATMSMSVVSTVVTIVIAIWVRRRTGSEVLEGRRIERTWKLLETYFSVSFVAVRSAAYKLKESGEAKPALFSAIARYLVGTFDPNDKEAPEKIPAANGLLPLQNLGLFLNFWHLMIILDRDDLLDRDMIAPLRAEIAVFGPFLENVAEASRKCDGRPQMLPDWVGAVSRITAWTTPPPRPTVQ